MVTVAQSAELWIVAPAVVGSSPIGHPFFMLFVFSNRGKDYLPARLLSRQ